ncbi:MAG: hypothetical protein J5898_12505 [Lachnospiraceae bacterium]|nr:hypothetical protein [Lachnospiraceae bacterium]
MRITGFFRRFICCLLVALLLIPAALADTVDLSSMTDAEIVALLEQVNQEIVRRGINKTANLPQGGYIAGKDLPVGRYILTVQAKGDDWGNLTVKSDEGNGKLILWEVVSAPENGEDPETIFITLSKGDKLECAVPFSLTIMSGAVFQ